MAGTANALKQRGDGLGGSDLNNQIDGSHVDAQFERSGGHQGTQGAGLEPRLRVQAFFAGHAPVVGGDDFGAQPVGQMMRKAFGHGARGHEYQGGLMFGDGTFQGLMDLFPDFIGHHCRERRFRQLDVQFQLTPVPDVEDLAGFCVSGEKMRHPLNGLLGGGDTDPVDRVPAEARQSLH